jgi:hypothetical protein
MILRLFPRGIDCKVAPQHAASPQNPEFNMKQTQPIFERTVCLFSSALLVTMIVSGTSHAQDKAEAPTQPESAAGEAGTEPAPAEAPPAQEEPKSDDAATETATPAEEPATEGAAESEGAAASTEEAAQGEGDAAAAAAPAIEMGTLTLSSQPSGKVFLDETDTGLMTPLIDHPIEAGTHTVRVLEESTGREKTLSFHVESGMPVNLNLNLPEQVQQEDTASDEDGSDTSAEEADDAADADTVSEESDWTWMTIAGWSTLGVGTMGLLAGAVILTNQNDPQQGPLGFGLFGVGIGMVMGGGVLLYLDTEFLGGDSDDADASGDDSEVAAFSFNNGLFE